MYASQHHVTPEHYLVTHSVGPNQQGVRLDHFLKSRYRSRSRQSIQTAIDEGWITIERHIGRHAPIPGKPKPSTPVMPGDEIRVLTERKPEPEVNFNYKVIFEDDSLFVIDKPPNLPVHPAGRYYFNTLLVHLKTQGFRDPLRGEREFFLVHRIDKETSGILVLTKDKETCARMTEQFAQRTTRKRYLAIVRGIPTESSFVIDAPMARAKHSKIELKMAILSEREGGQTAYTAFHVLETCRNRHGEFALVECHPKTGRQHQIRLHLEHAGHPILGDKLYGMSEQAALAFFERETLSAERWAALIHPRHALHAAGLSFNHPVTGKRIEFESELPADLRSFLAIGPT
ncbi:MAG: RluA family pseudouridine synthase [Oligoflexia bacterium]